MKKLDRSLANIPTCLNNLSHVTHLWDCMHKKRGKKGKRIVQVWAEIDKVQEKLCAYCESDAYKGTNTGHIEHFFDKGTPAHKNLTFAWSNLFGCCSSTTHCGHYKDDTLPGGVQRQYNSTLLLKPDIDDPEDYLQFLTNGTIKAKDGLNPNDNRRAEETIKALNLTCSELNIARENQIERYQSRLTALLELLDTDDEEEDNVDIEYDELKKEANSASYRTAVKQAVHWL